jgi:hypothetical protein
MNGTHWLTNVSGTSKCRHCTDTGIVALDYQTAGSELAAPCPVCEVGWAKAKTWEGCAPEHTFWQQPGWAESLEWVSWEGGMMITGERIELFPSVTVAKDRVSA